MAYTLHRERFDFKDPSMSQLLEQAPLLPMPAVANFLRDLALHGATVGQLGWTTRALATARVILQARPPTRKPLLDMVLQQATGGHSAVRTLAIKLIANRLYTKECPSIAAEVCRCKGCYLCALCAHHRHHRWRRLPAPSCARPPRPSNPIRMRRRQRWIPQSAMQRLRRVTCAAC